MFQDILEFKIENKKKLYEKLFKNVVSDLWGKKVYVSTKVILEKKFVNQKRLKTKNHKNIHNLCHLIWTKLVLFCNFLRPHFQNSCR